MKQPQMTVKDTAMIYKAAVGSRKNMTEEDKAEAVRVTSNLAGALTTVCVWAFLTEKGIPQQFAVPLALAAGEFVAFGVKMVGPKVLDKILDAIEKKDKPTQEKIFGEAALRLGKADKKRLFRPLGAVRNVTAAPAVC